MIDISIDIKINEEKTKDLPKLEKIEGIILYCLPSLFNHKDDKAFTDTAENIVESKNYSSDKGFHFVMDANKIIHCVSVEKQTTHLDGGKKTYIENSLFEGKTNEKTISVMMVIPENDDYAIIERKFIKFVANFMADHELEMKHIWRSFDLNKVGSPLHFLQEDRWKELLKRIEDTYNSIKNKDFKDETLEGMDPIISDEDVKKFYKKYYMNAISYSKDHNINDRGIAEASDQVPKTNNEMKTYVTKNKVTFSYNINENPPENKSHCAREYDQLNAKASPSLLEVEPIYPDLIAPPGGTITLVDKIDGKQTVVENHTQLSSELFEKRSRSLNINDYKDALKEIKGGPVNLKDPYPVDQKIRELESHTPKLKIDEVEFKLYDCNHPESKIGPEVAKNFAMVQDEIITLAKRTERRLAKVENIMATVMRNVFRMSSRMHVNCVYYGGQDIYGKYKCIRCLHNDRVDDGGSMTIDQCLSCTRYEPIIGQVYAILDDAGANIAQVLDDMQMSYASIEKYSEFTRNEEMHTERDYAKLSEEGEVPKTFEELTDKSFEMDWNYTQLENQRPSIAPYEVEGMKANKQEIKDDKQASKQEEFKEVYEDGESSESVKYNSNDYEFDSFGTVADIASSSDPNRTSNRIGGSATEIRNKIVEYAMNAVKLCEQGKALYSQTSRYAHLDKAINGISYWDCSSLTEKAYEAAGITGFGYNTFTQYPNCLPSAGGIVFPATEVDKALPGDMVWFTSSGAKPTNEQECINVQNGSIGHVGIYIGDKKFAHAADNANPPLKQIKVTEMQYYMPFAFGRPKGLVEADAAVSKDGDPYAPHNGQMTTAMAKFIMAWEGFMAEPYYDTGGVLTIGCGLTQSYPDLFNSMLPRCTIEQAAEAVKIVGESKAKQVVETLERRNIKLNQHQFDVMVCLVYGGGLQALLDLLAKCPDLLSMTKELYLSHYIRDASGTRLQGLVNRRTDEWEIWTNAEYERNH